MKKIVHYIPGLINGGIETMLLNYYEKLNKNFEFIIIVHGKIEDSCKEKFEKLGSKIYKIPHWTDNLLKHNKELYSILKKEKPVIFHSHHGIYNFIPMIVAMRADIKIRISHSHAYFPNKSIKERIYSFLTDLFSTNLVACGKGAAEYLSPKGNANKVKVIYNAIDLEKFKYNDDKRKEIKKEMGWDNNTIYGNVGRFSTQKNQLFLIDIYERIYEYDNLSRFLIIGGTGDKYQEIMDKLNNSKIKDYCVVLKNIKNVNEYYSVMDVLILPSLYEGFPVCAIESQVSNLPCILSPTITRELDTNNIYYSDTLENFDDWMNVIKKVKKTNRRKTNNSLDIFDINKSYKNLENYYNDLIKGGQR